MDLQSAFPERLSFYHLGEARLDRRAPMDWVIPPGSVASAISLQGDVRGLFLLIFDESLEYSTYSELANVLASRFVTELSDRDAKDVMISPPRRLGFEQLCGLITSDENLVRTSYSLGNVSVQAVIIQVAEAAANA